VKLSTDARSEGACPGRGPAGLRGHRCRRQREIGGGDDRLLDEERHPIHRVRQLANVAGPGIAEDRAAGVVAQLLRRNRVVRACASEEGLGQLQDVLASLAERGEREDEHREPVVEILAKPPLANSLTQVAVRRRNDQHVDRTASCFPQRPDFTGFDHGEQLGLQRFGQEPDLVQEQRAPMGGFDQPGAGLARVREGAALEAEQLGLEQGSRDSRAIQVDEGARRARAGLVNGPREQPLAGSRLALEQDGGHPPAGAEARQQALDARHNRPDRGTAAEDLPAILEHCNGDYSRTIS
jgi:hypothetical protein